MIVGVNRVPIGNDLWDWSVRVQGSDEELDRINKVIWYLNHTFNNPVVTVADRETRFEPAYPDEEASPAMCRGMTGRKNKVLFSYGAEDRKRLVQIRDKLEARGYEILDSSDTEPGLPRDAVVNKMVRDSDLVMGFITSDFSSPLVVSELNRANQSEKPIS
jgi:hypothetical protein